METCRIDDAIRRFSPGDNLIMMGLQIISVRLDKRPLILLKYGGRNGPVRRKHQVPHQRGKNRRTAKFRAHYHRHPHDFNALVYHRKIEIGDINLQITGTGVLDRPTFPFKIEPELLDTPVNWHIDLSQGILAKNAVRLQSMSVLKAFQSINHMPIKGPTR